MSTFNTEASASIPDDVLSRLRKLLRLADTSRGATAAEASLAMAKAQELMTAYGIARAHIDPDAESKKAAFEIGLDKVVMPRNQKYVYEDYTAEIVAACFGVQIIWYQTYVDNSTHASKLHHTWGFVGDGPDIMMAKIAMPIINDAFHKGLAAYLRSTGQKWTAKVAKGYFWGLERGYLEGSEEGRKRAMAAAKKKDADAYAIVLVDKADAICAYMKKIPLKAAANRGTKERDAEAFRAGYATGSRLSVDFGPKLT